MHTLRLVALLALCSLAACAPNPPSPAADVPTATAAATAPASPSPAATTAPASPSPATTATTAPASPSPATLDTTITPEAPSAATEMTATGESASPAPAGDTGATVDALGVSFVLPPGLASGATGETVPAAGLGDAQAPAWAIYPEHRRFTLQGYAVPSDPLEPTVAVFPLEAYTSAAPMAAEAIALLQNLLTAQTASPESIPVLPVLNAAQLLRAQVQYLPFEAGRGVRFVSFYAQNAAQLSNPGLLYIYQGLTDDGQHLVSVTVPITSPALDAAAPVVPFPTPDATGGFTPEAYQGYITAVTEQLNLLGSAEFTPDLAQIDALVRSIRVE